LPSVDRSPPAAQGSNHLDNGGNRPRFQPKWSLNGQVPYHQHQRYQNDGADRPAGGHAALRRRRM
jgi:hypothetical protein